MKMTIIRIIFTIFVVGLIVLPIPPSTIIGVAIMSHPQTKKHMDSRVIAAMTFGGYLFKETVIASMGGRVDHPHYHHVVNQPGHEIHA